VGGANGKVLVIDTEGAFRPERLAPIAERYGLDVDAVLENVTYVRAFTSEHQMELLQEAAGLLAEDCYRCLIIDSATALFRVDYTGRGELAGRQQVRLSLTLSRAVSLDHDHRARSLCRACCLSPLSLSRARALLSPRRSC
jgi:meiotic recombination protein DMC1